MKKIILALGATLMSVIAPAQDKVEATVSADIVSQYIWRGLEQTSAAIQPTLGIGYKGFSLTAWGSCGIVDPNETKEFDLTLGYKIGGFNIGVTDYWLSNGQDPQSRYFIYYAHSTNHVFEANVGYDFKLLSLQWYTNFTGNDGVTKSGKRAYSSYFEINVPFKLATLDWTATLGAVPYATSFYDTTGFAVTNVAVRATKDIKITDTFSIPIFGQIIASPRQQTAFFVFGFTLQP